MSDELSLITDFTDEEIESTIRPLGLMSAALMPPRPDFPSPDNDARARMLGTFRFNVAPNKSDIIISGGWAQKNIVRVFIPQLIGVENAPASGVIWFHKAGAAQLQAMFAAWERADLIHLIKTWAGSFAPRLIRGSSNVSNHAYGSAFDINAAWNGLGRIPATGTGTVIPLVKIANEHGFFWGGHYQKRLDGMHFELAVLNKFPSKVVKTTNVKPLAESPVVTESKTENAQNVGFGQPAIDPHPEPETSAGNALSSGAGQPEKEWEMGVDPSKVGEVSTEKTVEKTVEETPTGTIETTVQKDSFQADKKEMSAPPKEGSTAQAATVTIAGITVPAIVVTAIGMISAWFNQGLIDGKAVFDLLIKFFSENTRYISYLIIAFIAFLALKKAFRQISFIVQMIINAAPKWHDIVILPNDKEKCGEKDK